MVESRTAPVGKGLRQTDHIRRKWWDVGEEEGGGSQEQVINFKLPDAAVSVISQANS